MLMLTLVVAAACRTSNGTPPESTLHEAAPASDGGVQPPAPGQPGSAAGGAPVSAKDRDEAARLEAAHPADTSTKAAPVAAGRLPQGHLGEASPAPSPIQGFDQHGAASCLPLAHGRSCIARPDALIALCQAKGGELRRCGDCATLCSRQVLAK